jgi:phage gp36-like protein
MAYSTEEDILEVIPRQNLVDLTDDENQGDYDPARVERAITDADAIIDSFLGGRYRVPLIEPVPVIIRRIAVDLAVYLLYRRRFELEMPPAMRQRYEDAIAELKRLEAGHMILEVDVVATGDIPLEIVGSSRPAIWPASLLRRMP